MAIRKTLRAALAPACLAASCLAVPAAARADESAAPRIAEKLSDPGNQMAVTAALIALSEALLDMDVTPFARMAGAVDPDTPLRDLPPDATLRDLAGPDADRMQQSLARRTPEMMGAMAGMAGALEAMMPQLRGMAGRMKDSIPR